MDIEIEKELEINSKRIIDPAGRDVRVLEDDQAGRIAAKCSKSIHDIYIEALKMGISPYRYIRNQNTISFEDQLTFKK